ncbi:MAG: HlyD family secretion protein [Anaeromyxobacter sp.]
MTPPVNPSSSPVHPVPPVAAEPRNEPTAPPRRRRFAVWGVLLALAVAAGLSGHRLWATRFDENTDDAQVEADVVAIAPRVGGRIAEVLVAEDAEVKAGQPVLRLDDADQAVKVRQAEAELATARAQASVARAQVTAARSSVTKAEAEAEKAALDLRRAQALKQGDAIADERFDATRIQDQAASAGAGTNRAQYAAALASVELADARVKAAQAALDAAHLQLGYTLVRAPADGQLSRFAARVGQLVQAGQTLGQLVPDQVYVVANFKETQTGTIRPGQPVDLTVDAYGDRVLHGRVQSLSGGTGARFALLPPDNASGNFVKVVERVPVRVALDAPPTDMPLRAGLSADVTVHTR